MKKNDEIREEELQDFSDLTMELLNNLDTSDLKAFDTVRESLNIRQRTLGHGKISTKESRRLSKSK